MEKTSSQQEIDILEVLAKIIDAIRANLALAIILPLMCAIAGYLLAKKEAPKVQSEMMITTNVLSEEQSVFLLEQYQAANPFPNISTEHQAKFVNLSHVVVRPYRSSDDRSVNLKLSLRLTDESAFPIFQQSILNFLENSEIAISQKRSIKNFETKMIEGIEKELTAIDDALVEMRASGNTTRSNAIDPAALYVERINLLERKLRLEPSSPSQYLFSVVEGFKVKTLQNISLTGYTIGGLAAGFTLLIIVIFIRSFITFYKNYKRSQS
ncbi:hypothetical protein [Pseudochryseolinea flava]|uniref:Polysaccharide chain length determinant N-terminal domain-containing protein n=1 Tax=Pseudochryseolinea flava TaxID=2059302 RepID=A0A364Y0D4_9BACT|nr:hypothetical protein [Pseudochryseolinea flava]RAV99742.1 hypothetical protein DQQ10_16985 [Pseudochryseolinea flava]